MPAGTHAETWHHQQSKEERRRKAPAKDHAAIVPCIGLAVKFTNCDISQKIMCSARRTAIVALIVCVGAVWTCPASCAAMSMESHHPRNVDRSAAVAMTSHEHHHMSSPVNDDSTNNGDATLRSTRGGCCANCGGSEQALLSAANPKPSAFKSAHIAATIPAGASTCAALRNRSASPPRHLPHHGPPSLGSAIPLRV